MIDLDQSVFVRSEVIVEENINSNSSTLETKNENKKTDDKVKKSTINNFSNGSRYIPKERLEVYKNKSIFILDNFRSLKAYGCKGFNFKKTFVQDKGVKNLVKTFISSIETSKNPIPVEEIFSVHRNLLEIEQ